MCYHIELVHACGHIQSDRRVRCDTPRSCKVPRGKPALWQIALDTVCEAGTCTIEAVRAQQEQDAVEARIDEVLEAEQDMEDWEEELETDVKETEKKEQRIKTREWEKWVEKTAREGRENLERRTAKIRELREGRVLVDSSWGWKGYEREQSVMEVRASKLRKEKMEQEQQSRERRTIKTLDEESMTRGLRSESAGAYQNLPTRSVDTIAQRESSGTTTIKMEEPGSGFYTPPGFWSERPSPAASQDVAIPEKLPVSPPASTSPEHLPQPLPRLNAVTETPSKGPDTSFEDEDANEDSKNIQLSSPPTSPLQTPIVKKEAVEPYSKAIFRFAHEPGRVFTKR